MTGHVHGGPPPTETPPRVSSWRILATLGFAGALAGGLIVTVYARTLPTIEAHRAALVESAVREVLKEPARIDTVYLVGDRLVDTLPAGADFRTTEHVFLGYDAADSMVGAAVTAGEPGFSDVISLIFGLEPRAGTLLGMKILGHKETPGLGDKIDRPAFTGEFAGVTVPLEGVKGAPSAPNQVQTITGATISSRAVIRIINSAIARWQPLLQAYLQGGAP